MSYWIRFLGWILLLRLANGFLQTRIRNQHTTDTTLIGWTPSQSRAVLIPYLLSSTKQSKKLLFALPSFPLITADDSWGNYAVLTGVAASSQILGNQTAIGRLLGPPVTAMACTFALASIGIINPGGTVAAKTLQLLALNLATPLILLGADFKDAANRCGPLLLSFAVAATSTTISCLVGWKLAGPSLTSALGRDGLVIAAALLAKNIGGGINYIAVCQSLHASPTAVAAGLCIDNIFALIYFPTTSILAAGRPDVDLLTATVDKNLSDRPSLSVQSLSTVLCLACALVWLGERLGGTSGSLPVCTLLTVLFAANSPGKWLAPLRPCADSLGTLGLYIFFATAGAPGIAVADSVRTSLVPISIFLGSLYSIHGGILYGCNRIFGKWRSFVPQRLLVASSSAIGGPATSVALAKAAGWESLLVPSLLVGNIGYAIATFLGLAFFAIFQT